MYTTRFSLLVHGNLVCGRGMGVMLCESSAPDVAMPEYTFICGPGFGSLTFLDCGRGQLDAARLRTRFTFPACLSHFLLYCFIIHTRMYDWTTDTRNRCIPYRRSDIYPKATLFLR